MKLRYILLFLLLLPQPMFSETVNKIIISGNRVDESVIRGRLAFKEGDEFDEAKLEKSRSNLYSLGLFKTLDISSSPAEKNGVIVTVDARDGWFILPWPFFGSRGGTRYGGGMLIEQNFFRRAERIFLFGNYQDNASLNTASVMFPGFNIGVFVDRRSYTEYLYTDGAYNSPLLAWDDMSKILKYGQIADTHNKETDAFRLNAGKPVGKDITVTLGVFSGNVKYGAPSPLPSDTGRIHAVQASASFGKIESRMDMLSGFGRIFGLGMADLNDKLKARSGSSTGHGFQLSVENSNKGFGSDFNYTKASLSAGRTTVFGGRNQFSLAAKTGFGTDIPASQLFATNRREGMKGTYAREFRGDSIVLVNASYKHSFSRNGTGQLNGEIFAEGAEALLGGISHDKTGAGINIAYQFWRFPLPLGFGYTYSFDDEDWQASVAVGGMF